MVGVAEEEEEVVVEEEEEEEEVEVGVTEASPEGVVLVDLLLLARGSLDGFGLMQKTERTSINNMNFFKLLQCFL